MRKAFRIALTTLAIGALGELSAQSQTSVRGSDCTGKPREGRVVTTCDPTIEISLEQAVSELGKGGDDRDALVEIKFFSTKPSKAFNLLLADLNPIPVEILSGNHDTNDEDYDALHIIWIIRALRYLSGGKDFCASTRYSFGTSLEEQDRKKWLTRRRGPGCLVFFATLPSGSTTYVAPTDAQKAVIAKWKRWYLEKGQARRWKPPQHGLPGDWLR